MYKVQLIVRPKTGVRDPQGDAVEEALGGVGYQGIKVHCVGRYLSMDVEAKSEDDAKRLVDDMCKRMLVNPNLETYQVEVVKA